MSALHLADPECEIARFLLSAYWQGLGHQIVWCTKDADGDGFELATNDIYPFAARIVDSEVCAQRISFMAAVGWLPGEEFSLGINGDSVRFVHDHEFKARSSSSLLVSECVLPLDKVALALGASSVATGVDAIDRLAISSTDQDWEVFELYSLQVLLDWSRRVPAVDLDIEAFPLGAARSLQARTRGARAALELAETAAEERAVEPVKRRRWWSRS